MRIGYPCINRSIGCTPARTFRLGSYTEDRLKETVKENLLCLSAILDYNVRHGLLLFRITSDMVPFASHPVCQFPWQEHFTEEFRMISEFIRRHRFRISMHPDQFVLLNTHDMGVLDRSIAELVYHIQVIDLMRLDITAKVQLHVGGFYGNKSLSMERFVKNYERLDDAIRSRLVVENDERLYTAADCLALHKQTGIPVLFDAFHHSVYNNGESVGEILAPLCATWKPKDGIPMVDYSSQQLGKRAGAHAETIDLEGFRHFLQLTKPHDLDIMLEIKDKEKSALSAFRLASSDPRFVSANKKNG